MKNLKKILLVVTAMSASVVCSAQEPDPFAPLGTVQKIGDSNIYKVTRTVAGKHGIGPLRYPVPVVTVNPDRADKYDLPADSYSSNQPAKFTINGKVALFEFVIIAIPPKDGQDYGTTIKGLRFLQYEN